MRVCLAQSCAAAVADSNHGSGSWLWHIEDHHPMPLIFWGTRSGLKVMPGPAMAVWGDATNYSSSCLCLGTMPRRVASAASVWRQFHDLPQLFGDDVIMTCCSCLEINAMIRHSCLEMIPQSTPAAASVWERCHDLTGSCLCLEMILQRVAAVWWLHRDDAMTYRLTAATSVFSR